MPRPRKFRGAKATPKRLEKDLLEKSGRLARDPSLLIPKCTGDCRGCYFDKILKKLEKVAVYRDKVERLLGFAVHGDQLVRAYAATLSLSAAGNIPFLATAKLPAGEISYAVRGKVDKEKLIGVQYFDDPDIRLLAYWDIARKRDLHIYSTADGLICSTKPLAPENYVKEMLDEAPYEFGDDHTCGHPDARVKLVIQWLSPDITLEICRDCLREVNLVQYLSGRIAARNPSDDFEVRVEHDFQYPDGGDKDAVQSFPLPSDLRQKYLQGEIGDQEVVSAYLQRKFEAIRNSGKKIYIIGEQCFGDDKEAFLNRIRGSDVEKKALTRLIMEKEIPLVTESDIAGRIIAELWDSHWKDLISYVADEGDLEEAKKNVKEGSPGALLKEAARIHATRKIHSSLPAYKRLGEIGTMADSFARIYKTEGKEALLRAMEKERSRGHRQRAIKYAFISAVSEADVKGWQFTAEEKDFGSYLAQFAKRLMEAEGEEYDEALKLLLEASGAMEEVERNESSHHHIHHKV